MSTPGGAGTGRAREIGEPFRCIQQAFQEASVEVSQNSLELLSSLATEFVAAPSRAITAILELLEVQCNAFCEDVGCSWER